MVQLPRVSMEASAEISIGGLKSENVHTSPGRPKGKISARIRKVMEFSGTGVGRIVYRRISHHDVEATVGMLSNMNIPLELESTHSMWQWPLVCVLS